ncbi:hypothetical protein A5686_20185 [Mycobacterium sp. E2479]|nr:hypothetical protein A5686_20185 [Mycobacterium sp. E2479]
MFTDNDCRYEDKDAAVESAAELYRPAPHFAWESKARPCESIIFSTTENVVGSGDIGLDSHQSHPETGDLRCPARLNQRTLLHLCSLHSWRSTYTSG